MVQILAYCQYVSIYWGMAELAAFGTISADLRLEVWNLRAAIAKKAKKKFTGRSISTESAVFPHFELTGQNTSLTHHIKFSQLKSNRSNWVKNGWNGVETAPETNIGQYQYIGTTPSKWYRIYWANLCALIYCQYIVLIVIGSYWFQPLIKDRHAVEVGSLE